MYMLKLGREYMANPNQDSKRKKSLQNDCAYMAINKASSHEDFGHMNHDQSPFLFVDDFGVKYVRKEHADHLIATLKEHYEI